VRAAMPAGCESGITSRMALCVEYHYVIEDLRLNDAYKELRGIVRDDTHAAELLLRSQRAWIAYRDSTCDFARDRGGVLESIACRQWMTTDRTRWLEENLKDRE
jgi:uncharacterized protein YecT (DUF1311 family)